MTSKGSIDINVRYILTPESKADIKKYLAENKEVLTMYDDQHDSIYLLGSGLGGRIVIVEDEILLRSANLETFAAITKLVTEGQR